MAAAEKPTALVDRDSAEALLKRLEWTVLRRLDGVLQGDYRTLMRGAGLDLADLREYQHHDDVRHIDWNVTARLQTPHVRQFTEDRELSAWFLVDLSASVDFGSDRFTKRTVAREFVAVLARLLTRHGNRVGRRASTATNSRATVRLVKRSEPKSTLAERSTRNHAESSRSSVNWRT